MRLLVAPSARGAVSRSLRGSRRGRRSRRYIRNSPGRAMRRCRSSSRMWRRSPRPGRGSLFSRCRTGWPTEFAGPLLEAGLRVDRSERGFSDQRSPRCTRSFTANRHDAPELLGESVYGLPELYREQIRARAARRVPGLLSHEHHSAACARCCGGGLLEPDEHRRFQHERGERRGAHGEDRLPFRGVQRERARLRRPETPASRGDRAGT